MSAATNGYRPFRKDRHGWSGGGVILNVGEQQDHVKPRLGEGNKPAESMWVKISVRTKTGDIVLVV